LGPSEFGNISYLNPAKILVFGPDKNSGKGRVFISGKSKNIDVIKSSKEVDVSEQYDNKHPIEISADEGLIITAKRGKFVRQLVIFLNSDIQGIINDNSSEDPPLTAA